MTAKLPGNAEVVIADQEKEPKTSLTKTIQLAKEPVINLSNP